MNKMREVEVVVTGAGQAGLSSAYHLRRGGGGGGGGGGGRVPPPPPRPGRA
ncbi:pyridine nucleotide-disulfide oxidoreductase, partial [Streptomyces misionensis]